MQSLSSHVLSCLHSSSLTSCSMTVSAPDLVVLMSCRRCWWCAPDIWTCPCALSPSLLTTSAFALWSCLLSTALQAVSVSCYPINPCCFFCLVLHYHSIHVVVSLFSLCLWFRPYAHALHCRPLFWLTLQAKMRTWHRGSAEVLCRGLVICFTHHLSSSLRLRLSWKTHDFTKYHQSLTVSCS